MGHIQDRWYRPAVNEHGYPILDARGRPKMEKTERYGTGQRYKVRYVDPQNNERSRSFADRCRGQAEDFLREVERDVRRNTYVDPDAGKVFFREFAQTWIDGHTFEATSRQSTESRLRSMILPYFGDMEIGSIRPTDVRKWNRWMQGKGKAASYQAVCFAHLSAVLTAAVDDRLITSNPCQVRSVNRPKPQPRKLVPWTRATVRKVHMALPQQHKIIAPIGAGLGLRQGEVFGLAVDALDRESMMVNVTRQVREVHGVLVFASPKRGRTREVPLSSCLLRLLDDHMEMFPPVSVTLPWSEPGGESVTVQLLLTTALGRPLDRRRFNRQVWHKACHRAGMNNPGRDDGMHALRHHYASVLLDAGESIKALSEYLGHTDPGFTLRTYTHLLPSSAERTRKAIDQQWAAVANRDENADGPMTA